MFTEEVKFNDPYFNDISKRLAQPKKKPTADDIFLFKQDVIRLEKVLEKSLVGDHAYCCNNREGQYIEWRRKERKIYTSFNNIKGKQLCELKDGSDEIIRLAISYNLLRHFAESLCCEKTDNYTVDQYKIVELLNNQAGIKDIYVFFNDDNRFNVSFLVSSNCCTITDYSEHFTFSSNLKSISFDAEQAEVIIKFASKFCDNNVYAIGTPGAFNQLILPDLKITC